MPANDIYQGEIHTTLQKNPNIYMFNYRVVTVIDESKVIFDLLNDLKNLESNLESLHTADVNFDCSIIRQVWPNSSVPSVDIADRPGTRICTAGNATLPGQCSLIATLYGDVQDPTKFNRGRDYWTGMCDTDQGNGSWTFGPGSIGESYQNFYLNQVQPEFVDAGNEYETGIFSRTMAKRTQLDPQDPKFNPGGVETYFFKLEEVRVRDLVRTQRRRQPEDPCEAFLQVQYGP